MGVCLQPAGDPNVGRRDLTSVLFLFFFSALFSSARAHMGWHDILRYISSPAIRPHVFIAANPVHSKHAQHAPAARKGAVGTAAARLCTCICMYRCSAPVSAPACSPEHAESVCRVRKHLDR